MLFLNEDMRQYSISTHTCTHIPEREKEDGLWLLVPPFSLLLSEDDELGLDEDTLENCLVLQSDNDMKYHTAVLIKSTY